jgi:protoporphyrinogen oxidase
VLNKDDRVIVIGAGPAGITAAYSLARRGVKVKVLESSDTVGGMARSLTLWGKRVDIGPHRFFSSDPRVNRFWLEAVDGEYQMVNRLTRIYYKQKFFSYPLQAFEALFKLGFFESFRCLCSFVFRQIKPKADEKKFDAWVINRFGDRLFGIFFKSYTEKLWGIPVGELDAEFAAQRIKKLSLWGAIKSAVLGNRGNKHRTLVDEFAYPSSGAGLVYERIQKKLEDLGGEVTFGSKVASVEKEANGFSVQLADGTREFCNELVSTMPITSLISMLEAPGRVLENAKSLRFRNTVVVYVLIEGKNPFPDQWIYVHSDQLKTGRITNFSNWNNKLSEENTHIICLEYWCYDEDELWRYADNELVEIAQRDLIASGLVNSNVIGEGKVIRVPKCYPVYKTGYRENLHSVQEFLNTIPGLHAIGRYGSFKYNNQDHSILMGLLVCENICESANHDLWAINSDYEYQESSRITATGLVSE